MCVGFPGRITAIDENGVAVVEIAGVKREVNLGLLGDTVGIGDYVVSHVGFAIQKIEKAEAEASLKILETLLREEQP